jgi:hypothetical protein
VTRVSSKKQCRLCGLPYYRPRGIGDRQWSARKFCSSTCARQHAQLERVALRAITDLLPDVPDGWERAGACRDADAELFSPADASGGMSTVALASTARRYCAGCPAIEHCALAADRRRDPGLWGGSYRGVARKPYTRTPLIPGAPLFPLPPAERTA